MDNHMTNQDEAQAATTLTARDVETMRLSDYLAADNDGGKTRDSGKSAGAPEPESDESHESEDDDDDSDEEEADDEAEADADDESEDDDASDSDDDDDGAEDYSSLTLEQARDRLAQKDKGVVKLQKKLQDLQAQAENRNSWDTAFASEEHFVDATKQFFEKVASLHGLTLDELVSQVGGDGNTSPSRWTSQDDDLITRVLESEDWEYESDREQAEKVLRAFNRLQGHSGPAGSSKTGKDETGASTDDPTSAAEIVKRDGKATLAKLSKVYQGFRLTDAQLVEAAQKHPGLSLFDAAKAAFVDELLRHQTTEAGKRKKTAPEMPSAGKRSAVKHAGWNPETGEFTLKGALEFEK